jgi:pimeloyl-ACP methyl ester carboxylesterase
MSSADRLRMKNTIGRLLLGAMLLTGCSDEQLLSPSTGPNLDDSAENGVTGPRTVEGEVGGAPYALFLPAAWNGELVLYAHGFRDAASPVGFRDQDGFYAVRDSLLNRGYAFAYSSFSENGLAIKDGAQHTHQLRGIFTSTFDQPGRTYLMGHSMGGVIAVKLAEQHPEQYDGALSMCAELGGMQATADYIAHIRVLFDYFYPGVLAGDPITVPVGIDLNSQVVLPTVQAITANPNGVGAIAQIMATMGTPIPFASGQQLVQSIVTALAFNVRVAPDLLDRTHGHSPFDNSATVYAAAALPPALLAHLNATVDRFSSTPDAENYLSHYYQPNGDIGVPVLTLSNRLDPVAVPFNEPRYAAAVAAAGNAANLSQRKSVNLYGHCVFTVGEQVRAFADLAAWVETGVRPTP